MITAGRLMTMLFTRKLDSGAVLPLPDQALL